MPMTSKSSIITESAEIGSQRLAPLHPGEVLREEFMLPLDLTAYAVAKACRVPRTRIERIAREESGITADTALRLGKFLGTSAEFWLGLQDDYDLECAKRDLRDTLEAIEPVAAETTRRPRAAFGQRSGQATMRSGTSSSGISTSLA